MDTLLERCLACEAVVSSGMSSRMPLLMLRSVVYTCPGGGEVGACIPGVVDATGVVGVANLPPLPGPSRFQKDPW
jgi:hypothetical protein